MVIETVVFTGFTSWRGKCSSRRPRGRIGARPEVLLGDCHVGHGAASRGRKLLRRGEGVPHPSPRAGRCQQRKLGTGAICFAILGCERAGSPQRGSLTLARISI